MIDHPDVDVAADEDELRAEFESIVERYDALRSELEELKSELPTGEDGNFTGKVFVVEGPIERWRDRHPEHVTEIAQLLEEYQAVFEQVDIGIEDPDAELAEGSDSEVGALMETMINWNVVLKPDDE